MLGARKSAGRVFFFLLFDGVNGKPKKTQYALLFKKGDEGRCAKGERKQIAGREQRSDGITLEDFTTIHVTVNICFRKTKTVE